MLIDSETFYSILASCKHNYQVISLYSFTVFYCHLLLRYRSVTQGILDIQYERVTYLIKNLLQILGT